MIGLKVSAAVMEETHQLLRAESLAKGIEAAVLWQGTHDGVVSAAIFPEQEGDFGRFSVSLDERRRIARSLRGSGELIVAQIHTHPKKAFHSPIDDREAIPRTAGAFSLVVPDFAARDALLTDSALYQLQTDGSWALVPLRLISHGE